MATDYLYNFPNATSGMDTIGTQILTSVPGLIPLMLLFVWFVVFLGGIIRQKARNGTADYPMWSTVASMSSFFLALLLSVSTGFIDLTILLVTTIVLIFSGVWFFLSERQGEV